MSISSRDKEQDVPDPVEDKKKYVRLWRIEASREFLLLMLVIIFAIATSAYNPHLLVQLGEDLVDIATQNNQMNEQNLNNTDRIIEYLDIANRNDTASGMDIIKVLLLYNQDIERDLSKIMDRLNISNTHFVDVNGTHAITENGTVKLPYPIDMRGFVPQEIAENKLNQSGVIAVN